MKNTPRAVLAGVALTAGAVLLFEVAITRIFAVTLWYYFGFGAISLALMGTAASAISCFIAPQKFLGAEHPKYLAKFALLLAVAAPFSIYVHLALPLTYFSLSTIGFIMTLAVQLVSLFIAFYAAGMCISIGLCRYASQISRVYFLDLLGASIGSLAVVPLLFVFSAPAVIFAVSAAAALAGLLFASMQALRFYRLASLALLVIAAVLLFKNDSWGPLKISHVKSYTRGALQDVEQKKVFEKWSPVSRVTVFAPKKTANEEHMIVANDAGAPTRLIRFDGDYSKLGYLVNNSREIAHQLQPNGEVLIIGSGGGMDVLTALAVGQRHITAVEINPVIADLGTKYFRDYIGNIFADPRVTLHVQEGRNYAASTSKTFDIVQITMIDSWAGAAAGAFLFNENSLYTKEAIHDYMGRLRPGGILSITRYVQFSEAIRLVNMMIEQQLEAGIERVENRLIVALEPPKKYRRATVLLKAGEFTSEEIERVLSQAEAFGFTLIQAPGLTLEKLDRSRPAHNIRALIGTLSEGEGAREEMVRSYPKNIAASTDDWPFFFFNNYFRDVLKIDQTEHPARRMAMPFLYGTFIIFAVLSLLTIFIPLWVVKRHELRGVPMQLPCLLYFACLGIGFMLIEISLIQRLTVFLGHPTYSFVVVLTSLLFASGMGSLVSEKINIEGRPGRLLWVLGAVVLVNAAHVIFLYDKFIALMSLPKTARIVLAVLAMLPTGFFMGMCFPLGTRIARKLSDSLIAWGWGINGACSVFASILSLVIALNLGLKAGLALGVFCYVLALLLIVRLKRGLLQTSTDDLSVGAKR